MPKIIGIFLICFVLLITFFSIATRPPTDFPIDKIIVIEKGLSASEVVDMFKKEKVVRSAVLLYITLLTADNAGNIKAGNYTFDKPLSVFGIAKFITTVSPQEDLVRLTFPEGFTAKEYARIAKDSLELFDEDKFISLTQTSEGYLFPETYFVPRDFQANELFTLLTRTYQEQILPLQEKFSNSNLTEIEILTLASLIEREANTPDSMRTVAGILINRLNLGMPLQVDASMEYVIDKPLSELAPEDLKIDSPYNTYLYKNLPPTPIGNPGLEAIMSVLDPLVSDYFYYITDAEGKFYYSKTFTEHKRNIARYLQ